MMIASSCHLYISLFCKDSKVGDLERNDQIFQKGEIGIGRLKECTKVSCQVQFQVQVHQFYATRSRIIRLKGKVSQLEELDEHHDDELKSLQSPE